MIETLHPLDRVKVREMGEIMQMVVTADMTAEQGRGEVLALVRSLLVCMRADCHAPDAEGLVGRVCALADARLGAAGNRECCSRRNPRPRASYGPRCMIPEGSVSPIDFFRRLVWLDRRPLLETIEPYRRRIFESVLWSFDEAGVPLCNLALCGRAKKNWKTGDLILAALYRFLVWPSAAGNDAFILANDEQQAGDDLSLAKKIISANPDLAAEVVVYAKEITRADGRGVLRILPARDAVGAHGKTFTFIGFDEIHGYRNHDLFEALAPDPTRLDALTWITSYASIRHSPGIPLHDFLQAGKRGDDPRMFFSSYSGDYTTDAAIGEEATPEERANPSMASWGNPGYLAQQKRRLPTHKYRRLHLNLPGAPEGAAFDADAVMGAIIPGRKRLPPEQGRRVVGFVDMSGGSSDDAVLGIAYVDDQMRRVVLTSLISQTGGVPFNPRNAVRKFVAELKSYGLRRVVGDAYAGQTFRADFEDAGTAYEVSKLSKADIYDEFEPKLNAGELELLDIGKLQEQLLTLVVKGSKIDHQVGDHDDFANAAAGACVYAARGDGALTQFSDYLGADGAGIEALFRPDAIFSSIVVGKDGSAAAAIWARQIHYGTPLALLDFETGLAGDAFLIGALDRMAELCDVTECGRYLVIADSVTLGRYADLAVSRGDPRAFWGSDLGPLADNPQLPAFAATHVNGGKVKLTRSALEKAHHHPLGGALDLRFTGAPTPLQLAALHGIVAGLEGA